MPAKPLPLGIAAPEILKPPPPQPPVARPGRDTPGPVAAPDPALLAPSVDYPGRSLPRIAEDGRMPMQVYASGFDGSTRRPRVGVLLAGVGLNGADSEDAIRSLPGAVTLAFSPYAADPSRLQEIARIAGHEYLEAIPMEPRNYPAYDAGNHSLLTGASLAENAQRLTWALTRTTGYAGATAALGDLRGERYADSPQQMLDMLRTIAGMGLYYVDPRPGAARLPLVWSRAVDLVIDEPPVRTEIEAKLARLEQIARDKGSALGLAGGVRPVTVDRLQAWTNSVASRGLVLAPVSALVQAPPSEASAGASAGGAAR